ncbi:hypothetical protein CYMTET_12046 [Cymbomonas tetramitiformis]|uniref:C2H2-type domain-containing protein n=1 Tax=Cymbomonas tetramitiformis TaxID=36881 RepID=A0AAE0GKV2_9CHLO|nr:hypothetical protein CYMTET_12046 [Cymbomonas tetramitiformis]
MSAFRTLRFSTVSPDGLNSPCERFRRQARQLQGQCNITQLPRATAKACSARAVRPNKPLRRRSNSKGHFEVNLAKGVTRPVLAPSRAESTEPRSLAVTSEQQRQDAQEGPVVPAPGLAPSVHEKHWCAVCQCGFRKEKNLRQHLAGKRHAGNAVAARQVVAVFRERAPEWAAELSEQRVTHEEREQELEAVVGRAWNMNELAHFPMHGRGKRRFRQGQEALAAGETTYARQAQSASILSPSATVADLSAYQKARLWRYCHGAMSKSPELADVLFGVAGTHPHLVRVKEVFESVEAFLALENFLVACAKHRTVHRIVDLACGHGLVGLLLAYRFPQRQVVCVDIERRAAFQAFMDAFDRWGHKHGKASTPVMENVTFLAADNAEAANYIDAQTCVTVVHGCNEVNRDCIEMAKANDALWAAMPCCVPSDLYLPGCSIRLMDGLNADTRYSALCGSMAHMYRAQWLIQIDRRITNRNILIAGGCEKDAEGSPVTKLIGYGRKKLVQV